MSTRLVHLLAAAFFAAFHLPPTIAQVTTPLAKPDVSTQLIVGTFDAGRPATAWLGLDIRLGPGWHTYWRSAGDAGAPPEFDWSGSRNVKDVSVEWPAPRRFSEDGIDTFGYVDRVLFPVQFRVQDETAPAHVSLKLVLYVCSIICTQNETQLEADIAPGSAPSDTQALIDNWRHKVPHETSPGLSIRSLRLERQPKPRLVIATLAQPPLDQPDVFVDGDPAVVGGHPQIASRSTGSAVITVPVDGLERADPNQPLRVTLIDGDRALEAVLPRPLDAPVPPPTTPAPATAAIWSMLASSLLGGFILNFMPCVFPVLSLKLMSLIDHPATETSPIRTAFLASAAGILASFAVLATALSTLKAAGAQIGWGLQFQQPAFLIAMVVVLAAFAANLLGLFEIRLPWWLAGRLAQTGHGRSVASHFFNGFVMTLLATPCSAPFVGTAIAFALSQQAPQIFLVFLGLGLGMASPYLCLAATPRLSKLLPRPGRWMLGLRALAAAAMMATALWLLSILAEVSGFISAVLVGIILLVPLLILTTSRLRLTHAAAGAIAAALIGLALIAATRLPGPTTDAGAQQISWQPLIPDHIEAMVRSGQTVFVDIGASWCVTCKVNEALIINSAAVRRRLTSRVVPVKADWTKPNEAIATYLRSFDRFGLPFNAVYGPSAPAGIVLPELLTQQTVLDAIDAASQSNHQKEDQK